MRITVTRIASILLTIGLACSQSSDKAAEEPVTVDSIQKENVEVDAPKGDASKAEDQSQDSLPILPPIILLDFGNNTEDENATADEKSKRTANGGLGYGLNRNALQPKKYSYYFPAGKSGTTVSIEESISPFLPKTIIERVPRGPTDSRRGQVAVQQSSFVASISGSSSPSQNQANLRRLSPHQTTKSQTVFGLRTKPQKVGTGNGFGAPQNFLATPKSTDGSFAIQKSGYGNNDVSTTPQSPLAFSTAEPIRYVTPSPAKFANSQGDSFTYATAAPFIPGANAQAYPGQRQNIQPDGNSQGFESSTVGPFNSNAQFASGGSQLPNEPRYTVENGVRYENKVFWKYPDGTVSDVQPPTYVETYAEYPQSLLDYPTKFPSSPPLPLTYENRATENGVLSQGPVQFPTVSEQAGQQPNPYVSSESLSSSLPQQQVYRLGYQNLVSQRQNVNLAQQRKPSSNVATSYSFSTSSSSSPSSSSRLFGKSKAGSSSSKGGCASCYRQTTSRYMVSSPNPEYADTTESPVNTTAPSGFNRFFASAQKHSGQPPPAYAPKVQEYLDTVLSENSGSPKHSFAHDFSRYSDLRYSDLLNYNPSISEYVRNPASILNVRPTFVQAGSSLIPVIILRVDGASPVRSKATPNVNLKALLQQYLLQYAKSIEDLAEPSTYNLGPESLANSATAGASKNPILDLIRLTQEDARDTPSYPSDSYTGKSSYETSNLKDPVDFVGHRYTGPFASQQQAKNVQILEDPRFASYSERN